MTAIGAYWHRVQGLQRDVKRYLMCTSLQSVSMSLSSLLFNIYLIGIGLDAAFIGLNSAVLSGVRMVCALPAGLIADRIGRKRSLLVGLAGMTLAQLGQSMFESGGLIVASSVLSGAFGALFFTSGAPFLTENSTGEQRAMLFTLNSSLMNLASFIASTGGGYLPRLFAALLRVDPESAVAYRGVMLTAVCVQALALLPVVALEDHAPVARRRTRALPVWHRFSQPRLLAKLILPRAIMAFGAGLVFPFLNLFYKQRFGVSDAALGWIFGITNVLAAVVMLWGGTVAERVGTVRAMFFARALSVPGLLVMGFVPSLPIVVLAHWVRSSLMRLGDPLYMAFAMEQLAADERATGSSLMSVGWNAGWSAGPYVSGLLQPHVGWGALFSGTIAFYSASLACVYWFFMRRPGKGPALGAAGRADAAGSE